MNYLKGHKVASVPALFVICRYLASEPDGASQAELQHALHPSGLTRGRGRQVAGGEDGPPAVLTASLAVGRDLVLLEAAETGTDRDRYRLPAALREEVLRVPAADSRAFRALVLRRLGARALAAVEAGQSPPDLALALTWLLQQDPLVPLLSRWGHGPEAAVRNSGLGAAVADAEQWRTLLRWARALGLAHFAQAGGRQCVLADPTTAVEDSLDVLPRRAAAAQWFQALRELLPVLGAPQLLIELPPDTAELPATTTLAVCKLERLGRLRLVAADDATDAVVLALGGRPQRVSEVHVLAAAA